LTFVKVAVLVLVAVAILAGSVMLGWNLSQGRLGAELPTFTPTVTKTATQTPTPTATSTPTVTPTPTQTPTPVPPQVYRVRAGDNLLSIAIDFDLTVAELKAFNGLDSDNITAGQELLIPPPTPTPGPTPTLRPGEPTATPAPFILYTVKSGDTLSTIAEEYGVNMDDIRLANDIPLDSVTIKVDQVLTIPQYTPTPPAQEAVLAGGTPAPRTVYEPPILLYPPDGTVFVGEEATVILQWASVGLLDEREFYQVELVIPTATGKDTITEYIRSTAWRVPVDVFPSSDVTDRTFAWRVGIARLVTEIGDPNYKTISRLDKRRTFVWNVVQP
jgi:LysM repeat protein